MAEQYENEVLSAFFSPINVSPEARTILTSMLGERYRTDFNKWLARDQSLQDREALKQQAAGLADYFLAPKNPGKTPGERLEWAFAQAAQGLFVGGTRSSCMLCIKAPPK